MRTGVIKVGFVLFLKVGLRSTLVLYQYQYGRSLSSGLRIHRNPSAPTPLMWCSIRAISGKMFVCGGVDLAVHRSSESRADFNSGYLYFRGYFFSCMLSPIHPRPPPPPPPNEPDEHKCSQGASSPPAAAPRRHDIAWGLQNQPVNNSLRHVHVGAPIIRAFSYVLYLHEAEHRQHLILLQDVFDLRLQLTEANKCRPSVVTWMAFYGRESAAARCCVIGFLLKVLLISCWEWIKTPDLMRIMEGRQLPLQGFILTREWVPSPQNVRICEGRWSEERLQQAGGSFSVKEE